MVKEKNVFLDPAQREIEISVGQIEVKLYNTDNNSFMAQYTRDKLSF